MLNCVVEDPLVQEVEKRLFQHFQSFTTEVVGINKQHPLSPVGGALAISRRAKQWEGLEDMKIGDLFLKT
jgi:hypothetical protein